METLLKILGGVFVAVFTALVSALAMLILLPLSALDGWILHCAWDWFVIPTFGGAPLAWATATGLTLLASWLVMQPSMKREEGGTGSILVRGVLASLFSWLMMWGVHMWIIH